MILYRLEITPQKGTIRLEERGVKRVFYLDTLVREDPSILDYLKKKFRPTDPIQNIEVNLEFLQIVAKTGRLYFKNSKINLASPTKIYWKEHNGIYTAVLGDIPLAECEYVACGWALLKESILPIVTNVAWKWVELFRKGPVALEGAQKKKFLDEEPPILSTQTQIIPELHLTDGTGCFANLIDGDEKDLFEAGFIRKIVGKSNYYCSGDKVHEALSLLLAVGWKVSSAIGKPIVAQTSISWDIREEKENLAVRGIIHFKDLETNLKNAMKTTGLFVEMEKGVGLLERKKIGEIQGEWRDEKLIVKKGILPFLEGDKVTWQEGLEKMVEGLKGVEKIELAPPGPTFHGTLLPYQQQGVNWLAFLKKWGFSGILADEMGLGKTVQVLAFFSHLRTNLPFLVVAPSSLLYQWKQEIHRFLPDMSVSIYAGPDRKLHHHQGVIITSYAILRIDEEILSRELFEVIVLDEANAIKTASTQTAKAACQLQGNFRISVTGTPMENRMDEIVSQFQFLMPHMALTDSWQMKPFILRRQKKDVEIQLPEKIEQITWVEMNEAQVALYEKYMTQFKSGLLAKVEKEGLSAHRMEVLEAILRFRQICVDPRIMGESILGSKIERILEDIDSRKTLIFSQFTSMLKIIASELEKRGRKVLYLDGEVKAEERLRLVAQFQEDPESTIFLISLKAGGVGLNLTKAETVFLMDPWWNEAVENQAIARAHRIGQKKSIFVKRYITPNTIEEKMLSLKEKKNAAAELLLEAEENLLQLFF
jgi:superfamily II DNA or RNA helicase